MTECLTVSVIAFVRYQVQEPITVLIIATGRVIF